MTKQSLEDPAFQASDTPSSLQIRQAYLNGSEGGCKKPPNLSQTPAGPTVAFSKKGGRYSRFPPRKRATDYYREDSQREEKKVEGKSITGPIGSEIIGHDLNENRQAANDFKALLEDDNAGEDTMEEKEEQKGEGSLLSKQPVHPCMDVLPSPEDEKNPPPSAQEVNDVLTNDKRHSNRSAERLRLDGLSDGLSEARSRNEYGRSVMGGQESGHGVIGNIQNDPNGSTTIVVTQAGCDIPMVKEPYCTQPPIHLSRVENEEDKVNIGPHTVSLDPDLPPLAIEHPARVWNSMIHSLKPELQPVVKWDYEKIPSVEEDDSTFWLAQLTIALPLTHPTITHHPLFYTLPENQYRKNYVAAVEALGGTKRWVGEPRKLKADATNTTLVKCISDNAVAWLLAPNGVHVAPHSDHRKGEAVPAQPNPPTPVNHENDVNHQPFTLSQFESLYPRHQDDSNTATDGTHHNIHMAENDNESYEIKIDEIDIDPAFSSSTQLDDSSSNPTHGEEHRETPFQKIMAAFHKTIGQKSNNMTSLISFAPNWDPFTGSESNHTSWDRPVQLTTLFHAGFGSTLTVGITPNVQLYQEACTHTYPEEAQNAVCQKALDLNVIGFMEWLKDTLAPPLSAKAVPFIPGQHVTDTKALSHKAPAASQLALIQEIDWKGKLAAFCTRTGRRPPVYREQTFVYEGIPTLVNGVTINGQTFSVPRNDRSLHDVEHNLARRVLCDYFGQKEKVSGPLMIAHNRQ
ncbi:uncharacterized protein L201_004898 [Kwoniella dendrophila CBS 6074]|uniref:Cryptic loci regulator 2 N-terminal domain-containing protein n=1 Tax=Kwoniella dendrophila CBS 6074 TaxID=1295534 RepID=A0AAX4JXL4_9TREE